MGELSESVPVVSVVILTYRHEPYIRAAIESVLAQQVSFPIEVLISDDSSPDKTWEIVNEYREHPWVRLLQHCREDVIMINGRPTGRHNWHQALLAARGEYVAYLDGDDFWTSPHKLQRQVDALRKYSDASLCFHSIERLEQSTGKKRVVVPWNAHVGYRFSHHVCHNRISSVSVMWRRTMMPLPFDETLLRRVPVGDYAVHAYCLDRGPGIFLPEVMATYRVHSGGIHQVYSTGQRDFGAMVLQLKRLLMEVLPSRRLELERGIAATQSAQVLNLLRQDRINEARKVAGVLKWRNIPRMPRYAARFVVAKLRVRAARS